MGKEIIFIAWVMSSLKFLRTRDSISIVPRIYIAFTLSIFGAGSLLHLVDFINTEPGVKSEVHFAFSDSQIVMVPVPQLLQILVIQHIKWVIPVQKKSVTRGWHQLSFNQYTKYINFLSCISILH